MITKYIIAGLFIVFAIVQWNDPDPLAWIGLYGGTAILSLISIWKKVPRWVYFLALGIITLWLFLLLPDFITWIQMGMPDIAATMKAEAPHIEYTREFLGLFITGFAVLYLLKK